MELLKATERRYTIVPACRGLQVCDLVELGQHSCFDLESRAGMGTNVYCETQVWKRMTTSAWCATSSILAMEASLVVSTCTRGCVRAIEAGHGIYERHRCDASKGSTGMYPAQGCHFRLQEWDATMEGRYRAEDIHIARGCRVVQTGRLNKDRLLLGWLHSTRGRPYPRALRGMASDEGITRMIETTMMKQ